MLLKAPDSVTASSTFAVTMASSISTHILVFPYAAQGHILPMLELTHKLALKGLTITILVTPKNLPILSPLLSAHPSIQTLVLPFPHHPKLPSGVENVKEIGNRGNQIITSALTKLQDPIIQWFKSHPAPPHAILSDFFLGWTNHLAEQLKVPRVAFFTTSSFISSMLPHMLGNIEAVRELEVVEFTDLPRSPSLIASQLPPLVRNYKESDSDWKILIDGLLANFSSWGSVFNSFNALEGEYLEHLKGKFCHNRVYGVGPLGLIEEQGSRNLARNQQDSDTRVFSWLDNQPEGSVLYVCFGSQKLLNKAQARALAAGLEQSMVRFIWVIRSPMSMQAEGGETQVAVLDDFEERVGYRGFVLKGWAPQIEILNHKAVGAFMSHCGWNSLLESVVAGVTIMAWPMEADQFINARLLAEDLGIAVRACDGEDAVPDPIELARIISETMSGHLPQKEKAEEFKDKAFEAVQEGGSSSKSFDEFVKELNQLSI